MIFPKCKEWTFPDQEKPRYFKLFGPAPPAVKPEPPVAQQDIILLSIAPQVPRHPEMMWKVFFQSPSAISSAIDNFRSVSSLTSVIMPNVVSKLHSFEELTVSLIPVHPRLHQRGSTLLLRWH